jgi:hypothetical protein
MKIERTGFWDVMSHASQHDTCVVFPTSEHAIALWPDYVLFAQDRFDHIVNTRIRVVLRDTHTVMRWWVPGMDLDREYTFVSPYGRSALWR